MNDQIKARQIVLRRLEQPIKLAMAAAAKKKEARAAKVAAAHEYGSYAELQEAYGLGDITEEEFEELADILEADAKTIENAISPEDIAAELLREFAGQISRELAEMEYNALPDDEKRRRDEKWNEVAKRHERDVKKDA